MKTRLSEPLGPGIERGLLNLQRQLSRTSAELLFEVFSQRGERGSIIVTRKLRNARPAKTRCLTRHRSYEKRN